MDYNYNQDNNQYGTTGNCPIIQPVNKGMGVLGAAIGAILGGALWCLVGMLGYVSAWIAVLIFIFATALYNKFSGAPKGAPTSKFGSLISAVFGVLVIVPADYVCFAYQIWKALNDGVRNRFPFMEVLRDMPLYMERYELWGDFIKNLMMGLVFTAAAAALLVTGALKSRKQKTESK